MRIFVIWDMSIPNLAGDLDGLRIHPRLQGWTLELLGLDQYAQGSALALIRGHLEHPETRGAMAVIDEANAHVGFEMGLALAAGKPLALFTTRQAHRGWSERPPLHGHLMHPASLSPRVVEGTLTRLRDQGPGAWNTVPRAPAPGTDVLLLWPDDRRGELLEGALPAGDPRRLPADGWALAQLPEQLDGVRRVVWVVPQPDPGERDGAENARLAVVAGYAKGLGLDVDMLVEEVPGGRELLDLRGLRTPWTGVEKLRELLARLLTPGAKPPPVDPLTAWRAWLRQRHAELIPFAPGMTETVLQRVVLELRLEACRSERPERWEGPRDPTLRTLLEVMSAPGQIGRFLVRAEPGAGKTTAARHLAWQMGEEGAGHVVVLVPLVELGSRSPFAWAEERSGIEGLGRRLAAEARVPGRVWLLLDGLDEVGQADIHDVLASIRRFGEAPEWADVVVVVLGREVAFQRQPLKEPWREATLCKLDRTQQTELLTRLAPEHTARLLGQIDRWPALREMASNPLLLTLFAVVGRVALQKGAAVPWTRVDLYGQAIDLLLEGGHREQRTPVKSPYIARMALGLLALELQELGGESWSRTEVTAAILRARAADAEVAGWVTETWGAAPEALRDDLDHNGGVLGRLDGTGEGWRFGHRSLREFLAAEGLRRVPGRQGGFEARWLGALAAVKKAEQAQGRGTPKERARTALEQAQADAARAGEVLALLASMEKGPDTRLDDLQARNPDALVRLLKTTEGLTPARVVGLMFGLEVRRVGGGVWDGDDLVPALLNTAVPVMKGEARPDVVSRCDALWARVVPGTSRLHLGMLWEALTRVAGVEPDRARFFGACGLGLPERVELDLVDIPGGTFVMGEERGFTGVPNTPPHPVTLAAFRLGRTTVTTAQYQRFAPDHTCPGGPDHPVTEVSWYEALLYAAWLGGGLPTEAEWEYACRAGTTTAWSFGDDEKRLAEHAWYNENADHQTHPVAQKRPNPWGLYDMHGNVWEWCQDDCRTYTADAATHPIGDPHGWRAVRGGSRWNDAGGCRSACRVRRRPRDRYVVWGFRVRLPSPARLDLRALDS
jgi:formylglycine-generating enzyme required for sulfatase activity